MIPQLFKPLREDPTFVNVLRTLPTVLTSSLFMLIGLLEVALACLKWMLFLGIIAATFLLGMVLLIVFVLVLVGILMGSANEEGDAEVRGDAKQDVYAEGKVEQETVLESDKEGNAEQEGPVLESNNEETATQLPREMFIVFNSDRQTEEEVENVLEDLWARAVAERGEDYEKDDWQSEIEIAKEAMKAAIRRRARSSEHRASK